MNLCSTRNTMRYHYRIKGDDLMDECMIPVCYYGCMCFWGSIANVVTCGLCFPCISAAALAPLFGFTYSMLSEADTRKSGANRRYILGYTVEEGEKNPSANPVVVTAATAVAAPVETSAVQVEVQPEPASAPAKDF